MFRVLGNESLAWGRVSLPDRTPSARCRKDRPAYSDSSSDLQLSANVEPLVSPRRCRRCGRRRLGTLSDIFRQISGRRRTGVLDDSDADIAVERFGPEV